MKAPPTCLSVQALVALVLWCCGTALLVLVTHGQLQHELVVEWTAPHASRGARHGRHRLPACAFCDVDDDGSDEVVCAAHAPEDPLDAPTRLVAYDQRTGTRKLSLDVGRVLAVAAARGRVLVLDADGVATCFEKDRPLWRATPLVLESVVASSAAVEVGGDDGTLVVVFAGGDSTQVAALSFDTGTTLWTQRSRRTTDVGSGFLADAATAGPQPKATNGWTADPRFWAATPHDDERVLPMINSVVDVVDVPPWTGAPAVVKVFGKDGTNASSSRGVVVRTRRGVASFGADGVFETDLPPRAVVVDGSRVVAAVDSSTPAPRRRDGRELPPCAAVGVRGLPPSTRHAFEISLCHDATVDHELALQRRHRSSLSRRPTFAAAPVVVDSKGAHFGRVNRRAVLGDAVLDVDALVEAASVFFFQGTRSNKRKNKAKKPSSDNNKKKEKNVLFAVGRGTTTLVDPETGRRRWLSRGTPTWANATAGHVVALRDDTLAVVAGQSKVALLAATDGTQLDELDLPLLWDDEIIQRLLLHEKEAQNSTTLLVLTTQFQTIALRITTTLHARFLLRVVAFFCAAALPMLLRLSSHEGHDDDAASWDRSLVLFLRRIYHASPPSKKKRARE
eukprot:CAMPEP_0118908194 /NCGR_PEP_ID=MMETSP1166-20130328/11317_1 /TAXON_ID=1104430 /ORGANISM="Chrysoreinhardia sp, Strain CCMP3193" /LENGTH=620 /DNA_ID=CAMNT_0006847581 /DNA_START=61 /DNA_END=1923 /DNA_ORIENTATION=-